MLGLENCQGFESFKFDSMVNERYAVNSEL